MQASLFARSPKDRTRSDRDDDIRGEEVHDDGKAEERDDDEHFSQFLPHGRASFGTILLLFMNDYLLVQFIRDIIFIQEIERI